MKPDAPVRFIELDREKQDRLLRVIARLLREREARDTDQLRDLRRGRRG